MSAMSTSRLVFGEKHQGAYSKPFNILYHIALSDFIKSLFLSQYSYSIFSSHACVSSVSSFGVRRTQRKRSWTSTIDGSTVNPFTQSCPPSPTSGKLAVASMKWGEWTGGQSDLKKRPLSRRIILVVIKYPPVSIGKLARCCPPTDRSGQRKQISTVVFLTMWLD